MSTGLQTTYAEFDRQVEAGLYEGDPRRFELIRGEIVEMMSPAGVPHDNAVDLLTAWSFDNAPRDEVRVRVQNSLGIPGLESLTVPDVAWVMRRNYRRRRPVAADVFLLIEVADSSIRYDRVTKGALFAEAGIGDYWIVNLQKQCIEIHRDPSPEGYRDVQTHGMDAVVRPLRFPAVELAVSDLFPPDEEEIPFEDE